jgi:hypothetical protein
VNPNKHILIFRKATDVVAFFYVTKFRKEFFNMNITILGNIILSSAMQEEAVNEMSMKIINAVANIVSGYASVDDDLEITMEIDVEEDHEVLLYT